MTARELIVETHRGIHDLSRVVGVLALLDLTPVALTCGPSGEGLIIRARLEGTEEKHALCAARLRALASVLRADFRRRASPKD